VTDTCTPNGSFLGFKYAVRVLLRKNCDGKTFVVLMEEDGEGKDSSNVAKDI